MAISLALTLVLFFVGAVAGTLGALLGIGGGVFLVPTFVLALHLPMRVAVGISLTTVIATSSVVSAGRVGRQLINMRLAMLLEVATTAGALTGGVVAWMLAPRVLQGLFGIVTGATAAVMMTRLRRRNVILDLTVDPGRLGGSYYEEESGAEVRYHVRRLPVALAASFLAGSVSSLLGIGGGTIKVPALNAWCGVPLRAAAAISALMIGVTATGGAIIYYARGEIIPSIAAATVLGVLAGSRAGFYISARSKALHLKLLMAAVLLIVSGLMFVRALQ
jgi:uncharacterized protein